MSTELHVLSRKTWQTQKHVSVLIGSLHSFLLTFTGVTSRGCSDVDVYLRGVSYAVTSELGVVRGATGWLTDRLWLGCISAERQHPIVAPLSFSLTSFRSKQKKKVKLRFFGSVIYYRPEQLNDSDLARLLTDGPHAQKKIKNLSINDLNFIL